MLAVEFYNLNASQFAADTTNVDMSALYARFLPKLPPDGIILDAGCGTGRDSRFFLAKGFTVCAFDASTEMVRLARELTGLDVRLSTFLSYQSDIHFDGIWACASLLHIAEAELAVTFNHLGSLLKSRGVLYCSFKLGSGEVQRDGRCFTQMTADRLGVVLSDTRLKIAEYWVTADARPGRKHEQWLNALLEARV